MAISKSELKYYLTNFRTRKSYFVFQLLQLTLSIVIVIVALFSDDMFRQPTVLWLELLLLLCMAFDLFLVRWISEGTLLKSKTNKIDFIIVIVFAFTFLFMCLTQNKIKQGKSAEYQILLETDDIILIGIICVRYAVQIYQMIKTIQNTQKNIDCQRKMKDVDLNMAPNGSIMDENNDDLQDQILRQRMQGKKRQQSKKQTNYSTDLE